MKPPKIMDKNKAVTPEEEKKNNAFKKLVERGKASGHLTAQEIDNLIVEMDLDVDELEKLKRDYPRDYETYIERLSLYITSKGARYKSHYAVIRQWLAKDGVKAENEKRAPVSGKDDLDKVERMLAAMKGGAQDADHVSP